MLRTTLPVAMVLALLAFGVPARADMAPPPDSPDAHCSLAEQCPNGVFCPYFMRPGVPPADGEAPVGEACRTQAAAKGLVRRCRDGGNYGGQALFCPQGETGSWASPKNPLAPTPEAPAGGASTTPPKKSSCAASPGATSGAASVTALVVLAGVALRRRRRRTLDH